MKLKYYFFYLASLVLFSCEQSKQLEDFPLINSSPKIALVGTISNQNQVQVRASKSVPPLGDVYADSLILKNPVVSLYKNNEFLQFLEENNEGLFVADNLEIKENDNYFITTSASGLEDVSSTVVSIPVLPIINTISFEDTGELTVNEQPVWKLDLNIRHQETIDYYRIRLSIENYPINSFETWYFDTNSELCNFRKGTGVNIFFDASCIHTENFDIQLFAQIPPFFYTLDDDTIPIDKVVVSVSSIEENYYKYLDSYIQPSGLENGFAEPKLTYSNIENGYGIFYGYHNIDTVFVVR